MPAFRDVRCVVENDEALDLTTGEGRDGCDAGLPTQNAKPAYAILVSFPMVADLNTWYIRTNYVTE
jgi:hypothetical protein